MSANNGVPTEDETRRLIARYQAGDRQAAELLLAAHGGLINRVIRNYKRRQGLSRQEYWNEGVVALLTAAKRFDLSLGTAKFSTYASWIILGGIQQLVRKMPYLPQEPKRLKPGRDMPVYTARLLERIPDADDPAPGAVDNTDVVLWAMQAILEEREQRCLGLLFGLEDGISRTQREAAQLLGVSLPTLRRIFHLACAKVREAYEADTRRRCA